MMSSEAAPSRGRQENYSSMRPQRMLDDRDRGVKAAKIVAVVKHFLGREDLTGLTVLDIGCSGGTIANALTEQGARALGADIDAGGVREARRRYSAPLGFVVGDGEALPFATGSVDVAVFNQSYEHIADPRRAVDEIVRVMRNDGVLYLGAHSRLTIFEPHYKLPFLSWLPPRVADRYLRLMGKGDQYYERLLTRGKLRRLFAPFWFWDYSYTVIAQPDRFRAEDVVGATGTRIVRRLPRWLMRLLAPLLPGWILIGRTTPQSPPTLPALIEPLRVEALPGADRS